MTATTDEEAARSLKVAEGIVEVLAAEPNSTLALAGVAMAISWLATTRAYTEADSLQLVEATSATAREQTAALYEAAQLTPEALN